MAFPQHLGEVVEGTLPAGGGAFAQNRECEGAKFHSPQPLVVHIVNLRDGTPAVLCGTCRDNYQVLESLLDSHQGDVAWPVRREFGNKIRALAERGWKAVADAV